MNQRRQLPQTASVAEPLEGNRLFAPSAARNAKVIARVLAEYAPLQGSALEIASGSGQHITAFARILKGLIWQPSDIHNSKLASIDDWAKDHPNIRPAVYLDATKPGWATRHAGQSLILLINLLHLISKPEARKLISEVALALEHGGRFYLYGPFLRDGVHVSDGDASFDASLRASDPDIGYKDINEVQQWLAEAGLHVIATVDMPANNLTLISERPQEVF